MRKYDFTLKFALARHGADPEQFVGRLLEEGCDDALIGIGKRGRIALNFGREANSADEAFLTAISDVKRAIPDVAFIEATPDLVGIPDIASVVGVTRQYVRKLVEDSTRDFPPPVHDGKRAIWHLETVLTWFSAECRDVDEATMEVSRLAMYCNHLKERQRLGKKIPETIRKAIAA
ncbi:MAG TPA: DNA-binding protein [Woeseiaceae bacterium]|nr:DNA-binding protein [Woeseiaceae bacterium]